MTSAGHSAFSQTDLRREAALLVRTQRLKSSRTVSPALCDAFRTLIYGYYRRHRRAFPWRGRLTPYQVLISEIMLQQTQTTRVVEKFPLFIKIFPTVQVLAHAPLKEIVRVWQGMGYNRRALALKRCAECIVRDHDGQVPDTVDALDSLPGIGPATAASISAFAFNKPTVFIETNIRSVFIYFFFHHASSVPDDKLLPLVRATLDRRNPRRWYNALMDYGALLKQRMPNPNRKSSNYIRQSPFKGSRRELRGKILRYAHMHNSFSIASICNFVHQPSEVVSCVLSELVREEFLRRKNGRYTFR